ncbi:MAG: glycoside hydrolase family 36 protein [Candidatus Glassbacteria bacterium]
MNKFISGSAVTLTAAALFLSVYSGCAGRFGRTVLEDGRIRLELTSNSGIKVLLIDNGKSIQLTTGEEPSFGFIDKSGNPVDFSVSRTAAATLPAGDEFGPGHGITAELEAAPGSPFAEVRLTLTLSLYDKFPGMVIGRVQAHGLTAGILAEIAKVRFFSLTARADLAEPGLSPYDFHLFQGPAYQQGRWYTKIKLTPNYSAPNSLTGGNAEQTELGGLPLVYLWTRQAGLALAHVDTLARVAALPLAVRADGAVELALERQPEFLRPDAEGNYAGLPVMIGAFHGDYFDPLSAYGKLLQRGGFRFSRPPAGSFEPLWCSWGFERKVVPDDLLRTLPTVKRLGLPWVVMDDGYQASIGLWPLDPKKFPRGDADMRALTDSIHNAGLKAELWWVPMNVQLTDPLYAEHPEWVWLGADGKPKLDDWWNVVQLCPAWPPVVEHHRLLVRKFMQDWGYDGFKMDGACQNMVAPCYNPAHHHQRPEEACEAVAGLYAVIKQEAEKIRPGCVLEICPCGIPPSPFLIAFSNQQVTADPTSSDQVRARIKMYHALLGQSAAPFGDHVELSTGPDGKRGGVEDGTDFASSLATGGIVGTKFTSLVEDAATRDVKRYQGIRSHWEHWIGLYNRLRLYEGRYLNLYDMAYDVPEVHVVAHGDTLYYGIFARDWKSAIQLRGLTEGVKYRLTDYAGDDRPLGEVQGGAGASFEGEVRDNLLVRAAPAL